MSKEDIHVYVRKRGKVYYEKNYTRACYKISLEEALKRGYKPAKKNNIVKINKK